MTTKVPVGSSDLETTISVLHGHCIRGKMQSTTQFIPLFAVPSEHQVTCSPAAPVLMGICIECVGSGILVPALWVLCAHKTVTMLCPMGQNYEELESVRSCVC